MAKLSVTLDGAILQEIALNKSRITIGRRPTNDVVLNHLAISGEHAVVTSNGNSSNDSFLEDRNSTNGTQVNGQPIKRHFLQNGDVITLARYQLKYESEAHTAKSAKPTIPALVKVLNGSNEGKKLVLSKELTTLGTPGVQVATISRINNSYLLRHIEGLQMTLVNDNEIGKNAFELRPSDVIELSGTRLMFEFA